MKRFVSHASPERIDAAVDALAHLLFDNSPRTAGQQKTLGLMRGWLVGSITEWVDDEEVCGALSALLGLSKDAAYEHLGAFMGPLLVWSTKQDWAGDISTARVFSAMCNLHFVRDSRTKPHETCLAALNHVHAWLPQLPAPLQRSLAAHALQDVNTKMDWPNRQRRPSIQRVDEWAITCLLASLVALYPKYRSSNNRSLHATWESVMSEYANRSLDVSEQSGWALWLLESSMPDAYKVHTCRFLVPEVWLQKPIHSALLALLPSSEEERFAQLPWAVSRSPAWTRALPDALPSETNHDMLKMYCPQSEQMVDLLASPTDWETQKTIASLMAQLQASLSHTEHFALPENMEGA